MGIIRGEGKLKCARERGRDPRDFGMMDGGVGTT